MTAQDAIHALWAASIATPLDLKTNGARDIAVALNLSLAVFALHLKTTSDQQTKDIDQWIRSRSPKKSTSRAGVFSALQP